MILLMQLSLLCKTSKCISVMQQHHLELQLNNIIAHKKEKQNISQGEFVHYWNWLCLIRTSLEDSKSDGKNIQPVHANFSQ